MCAMALVVWIPDNLVLVVDRYLLGIRGFLGSSFPYMYTAERACGFRSPIDRGAKPSIQTADAGDITPHPVLSEQAPHVITAESLSGANRI